MVAEETLGVGQFSCGGYLGPSEDERLLVEHPGVHEDQHEDGGQAVGLRRHAQRMRFQGGGRGVHQGVIMISR